MGYRPPAMQISCSTMWSAGEAGCEDSAVSWLASESP